MTLKIRPGHAILMLGAVASLLPFSSLAANALAGSPSPDHAMHGRDPVQWRPWGPDALTEAGHDDKPLFISSGYFACHWCHVMQRERDQNRQIAARLNRYFVPVKLDRELHPALDAYLIGFVERTTGQGVAPEPSSGPWRVTPSRG